MNLTQNKLQELFEYRDGELYHKSTGKGKRQNVPVGSFNFGGYKRTKIKYKHYFIHRLIYLMHHGNMPKNIDHIDGNPANNRIENLRECTPSQNSKNRSKFKPCKNSIKNVYQQKENGKYVVSVYSNGKSHYCGSFDDLELAELVAIEARDKYHKEFAKHE